MLFRSHPLLAPVALNNLKELRKFSNEEVEAVYHFVLVNETEIQITRTTVKKGNRFTRFILHVFMMKTEKIIEGAECIEKPPPKNRIDFTNNSLEVWI